MTVHDPTTLLNHSVQLAQERHHLFPTTQDGTALPVIVGVSGGADSICLLHLLMHCARLWNLSLHVAHLDHNVRPGSAQDALFVQEIAESWDVPFHTRRLTQAEIDEADHNLEAALRRLRYAFFADIYFANIAESQGTTQDTLPTVAVAHTADDQAETILMHILRGSGLAGMAGMRPVSFPLVQAHENRAVRLVRPLLDVQHAQVLQYLNAHDLSWREDPSNHDITFTRNRLRQQIIPQLTELYPNLTAALSRLGAILAGENDRANQLNERAFRTLLQQENPPESLADSDPPERAVMDRPAFRLLDLATQRGVLRVAAAYLGLSTEEMNYERTENLRIALVSDTMGNNPTPLVNGIVCSAETDRFSLHQESALAFHVDTPFFDTQWRARIGIHTLPMPGELHIDGWKLVCRVTDRAALPQDWKTNGDPWQAVCDVRFVGTLALTTFHQGQQFAPLGMGGHHKQVGDFFTDNKIPPALRSGWPLLLNRDTGEILWVCGLQMGHSARIRPSSERVLHLTWSKI